MFKSGDKYDRNGIKLLVVQDYFAISCMESENLTQLNE